VISVPDIRGKTSTSLCLSRYPELLLIYKFYNIRAEKMILVVVNSLKTYSHPEIIKATDHHKESPLHLSGKNAVPGRISHESLKDEV
jgi:hypothetical protein